MTAYSSVEPIDLRASSRRARIVCVFTQPPRVRNTSVVALAPAAEVWCTVCCVVHAHVIRRRLERIARRNTSTSIPRLTDQLLCKNVQAVPLNTTAEGILSDHVLPGGYTALRRRAGRSRDAAR